MASQAESSESLLMEEGFEFKYCLHCGQRARKPTLTRGFTRSKIFWAISYGIVITFALGVAFFSGQYSTSQRGAPRAMSLWTPVTNSIKYNVQYTPPDYWTNGVYMGPPSDDLERAWNRLIHPTPGHVHGFRLYRDEAKQLELNESALLTDNNFAALMTVHHNLHCLRRIRQTFFKDHYYPGWQESGIEEEMQGHSLHCLESIRQSLICQPELTVMPYRWTSGPDPELMANPVAKRECVNWELLNNGLKPRKYPREDLVGV